MQPFKLQCLTAMAYSAVAVAVVCTSSLLVDDLANSFVTNRNNLGSWTSGKTLQV